MLDGKFCLRSDSPSRRASTCSTALESELDLQEFNPSDTNEPEDRCGGKKKRKKRKACRKPRKRCPGKKRKPKCKKRKRRNKCGGR